MKQLDEMLRLIEKDPHQWSNRPCGTCRQISELAGRAFGCEKKAGRLPMAPQDRIAPRAVNPPKAAKDDRVLTAATVCFLRCRCGAYGARSWIHPRRVDTACEQCGQPMELVGATRMTTTAVGDSELGVLKEEIRGR